jgi:hypothetical protein
LGPTTAVIPPLNSKRVRPTNDLKPRSSNRLMCIDTGPPPPSQMQTHLFGSAASTHPTDVPMREPPRCYPAERSVSSRSQHTPSAPQRYGDYSFYRFRLSSSTSKGDHLGRNGRRRMPASSGVRPPLTRLHRLHEQATSFQLEAPPRDLGGHDPASTRFATAGFHSTYSDGDSGRGCSRERTVTKCRRTTLAHLALSSRPLPFQSPRIYKHSGPAG